MGSGRGEAGELNVHSIGFLKLGAQQIQDASPGLWDAMPTGLAPMAKRRFMICEALQAFSAVMAMFAVITWW